MDGFERIFCKVVYLRCVYWFRVFFLVLNQRREIMFIFWVQYWCYFFQKDFLDVQWMLFIDLEFFGV